MVFGSNPSLNDCKNFPNCIDKTHRCVLGIYFLANKIGYLSVSTHFCFFLKPECFYHLFVSTLLYVNKFLFCESFALLLLFCFSYIVCIILLSCSFLFFLSHVIVYYIYTWPNALQYSKI